MIKTLLAQVKEFKKASFLTPVFMILEVVVETMIPLVMADMIDNGVEAGNISYLYRKGAIMALLAVAGLVTGILGGKYGAYASSGFARNLRKAMYTNIQAFSFSNIDGFSTGSLVTRLTNDVQQVQNLVNMMLRMFLRAPGMLIGALIMAISLNASLSLVLAVALPVVLGSMLAVISRGFPRFSKMQTKIDALNSRVRENVTNVRVIKSFVREDYERERFKKSNTDLKDATLSAMRVMITMMPMMMLFMNLTTIAVLWFGGRLVISSSMEVGDLTAFVTYITQILFSLMMVVMMFLQSSRALASARRIKEVLNTVSDISDKEAKCPDKKITEGKIVFDNVNFRYYKNSKEKVLDDISFTINPGETVGIIGSTGCGKQLSYL